MEVIKLPKKFRMVCYEIMDGKEGALDTLESFADKYPHQVAAVKAEVAYFNLDYEKALALDLAILPWLEEWYYSNVSDEHMIAMTVAAIRLHREQELIEALTKEQARIRAENGLAQRDRFCDILMDYLKRGVMPFADNDKNYAFDPDKVAEYRQKMLAAPIKDGKAVLEELIGLRKEETEDDEMDWAEEILGEMEGGYDNCRFSSYWNSDTNMTYPLILAKIPVKNPWEIFAYLPFGNWNECPDTPELMAVAKYWFEQYGAVPAAMTHDELDFELPAPISKEKAMEAATEQYGFCADIVDQEQDDPTVGNLADVLWQSTVWYFWWD